MKSLRKYKSYEKANHLKTLISEIKEILVIFDYETIDTIPIFLDHLIEKIELYDLDSLSDNEIKYIIKKHRVVEKVEKKS
ncbi:hypothetical protein SAMN04488700_0372 [Carnobacterium iners]|uniref:Uncharacterized protein n=1 Tax=Carnobacterium iners TaxID=1073423 RepID=A0A1X7MSH7_9LACT|nr:hypothetical protein [Carnobacterium iners]SEL30622.1 hypothetical protein SAMN04488114_1498 [Carnobacterium iners]SMH26986.1 hypothetical protein SAMN04488700_0372 [Carnobacterium iners]